MDTFLEQSRTFMFAVTETFHLINTSRAGVELLSAQVERVVQAGATDQIIEALFPTPEGTSGQNLRAHTLRHQTAKDRDLAEMWLFVVFARYESWAESLELEYNITNAKREIHLALVRDVIALLHRLVFTIDSQVLLSPQGKEALLNRWRTVHGSEPVKVSYNKLQRPKWFDAMISRDLAMPSPPSLDGIGGPVWPLASRQAFVDFATACRSRTQPRARRRTFRIIEAEKPMRSAMRSKFSPSARSVCLAALPHSSTTASR